MRTKREADGEADYKLLLEKVKKSSPTLHRALEVAGEKGGSCVFSVRPSEEHDFCFHSKRDWRDLVALRYARPVRGLAKVCACGANFTVQHSQQCPKGGFIHHRHNEMEVLWARECKKVFLDVECEPVLLDLEGEEECFGIKSANTAEEARSDVRVRGFWGNRRDAFFDFRVFYPFARSYSLRSLQSLYKAFSKEKKREYEERIGQVDGGSFTPMVMSSVGGMGPEMGIALKYLASLIAAKEGCQYSQAVSVLRCKFSFAAARTALVCLRGSRSLFANRRHVANVRDSDAPVEIVCSDM